MDNFPRIHHIGNSRRDATEHFKGRIIFVPMDNDIVWDEETENCIANAHRVTEYARRYPQGRWSFPGPQLQKKWCGTHRHKPDGEWDKIEDMMLSFAESGHPFFRATAIERGELKSKGKGVKSIHFNGSDDAIELIFRTIISVNQLSVHGAVADLCGKLARGSRGTGKAGATGNLESMV